jgi:hypothetical protein
MHARMKALPFQTCSPDTRPDRSIHMKVEGKRSEGQTAQLRLCPISDLPIYIGAVWKESQALPSPKSAQSRSA